MTYLIMIPKGPINVRLCDAKNRSGSSTPQPHRFEIQAA
jgi:hypothetical protein